MWLETSKENKNDHIEIKFPKGKITSKQIAVIVLFAIFLYLLTEALKSIFSSGFPNPNYALVVIALILGAITIVAVYAIRKLTEENHEMP